jgi:carboxyl-terminal processing protease
MIKKSHNYRSLLLVVILILCFLFGFETGKQQGAKEMTEIESKNIEVKNSEEKADLSLFWEVWNFLNDNYFEKNLLDSKKMSYGAIKGMVASFDDPYTVYMDPVETEEFKHNLDGELEGIGAELSMENNLLTVITPMKDSPAEKAGIRAGDIVYSIDGEPTTDMNLIEAVLKIRGEKGTVVTLTVIHKNETDPVDYKITRDTVNIKSIDYKYLENDIIAYIDVLQFGDDTTHEFEEAVSDVVLKNVKGLILDLRFNGGGYLDIAVDMISEFLPKDYKAVTIRRRNEKDNEILYTLGNPKLPNIPIAVLVNDGTASSAEIVAGAIQDHKRGIIIGTKTYGKGSVQEVKNFKDGSSLRATIAKWFTPNDVNIDEVGIKPDIEIEDTLEDLKAGKDLQLEEAIKYLKNK